MEDKDFIDFKFNGHWASEFNLVAISDGDRYNSPFFGSVSPNTTTLIGKTGIQKWNTQIGEKVFNIKIAYDNLDLSVLKKIKVWLNPFIIEKIVFKEEPYKYFWVSLNEEPQISFLPCRTENVIVNGREYKKGIYKGELTLSFICVDNNGYSDWQSFDENYDYIVNELGGENFISFDNGSDNNLIIQEIEGNSVQETRSGKNKLLYPYNNISNTIIEDLGNGKLIINGTLEENTNLVLQNVDLKSGNYKFIFNKVAIPNKSYIIIKNITKDEIINNYVTSDTTFLIAEDSQIKISMVLVKGTYTNYKMDLMILEATEEDETFEQYGVSPSPEYPSEIQNVEGNIDITICNNNLFNSKIISNGSIITVNDDYSITLQNNSNISGYVNTGKKLKETCKGLKQGETIFLKLITTFKSKYIYLIGANVTFNDGESKVLTEEMLESNIAIYGGYQSIDTLQIQISLNKLEEYTQHQSQTITFPLSEGQKLMKGDYLADDGIYHKRKQFEVDGTNLKVNGVIKYTNGLYYCKVSIPFTSIDFSDGYSTHFKWVKSGIAIGNCYVTGAGKGLVFILEDQNITTVEGANNWLIQQKQAGTPVKFECELAEEEIEPYTSEQQLVKKIMKDGLYSYEGQNNVFLTSSAPVNFKIAYVPEQNIYIDFVTDGSDLLNSSSFYYTNNIHSKSYEDLESGNPETSGITSERAEYLYNAGNTVANLNLTFDYIPPQQNSPLEINIDKVKLTSNGWEVIEEKISNIKLEYFTDYKPFTDLLKEAYSLEDLNELPEKWQDDWQLEINSDIKEIYFKNKKDKNLIISLNKFNVNQNFLQLGESNFVDYSKTFPTLLSEIDNSAIKETYFNKIYLTKTTQNYRLKNIYLDWKHTYI